MAIKRMGFEGEIYYGAAGTTAATRITAAVDISYNLETEEGETTERGDSSAPPIETMRVTVRRVSIEFNMRNKDGDTTLAALFAASFSGSPVALRLKDKAAGKGYDGDVILSHKFSSPLKDGQNIEFTAKPTDESNRTPQLYV